MQNFRKDARLPVQLQRAMAAEAEAAREARAKVSWNFYSLQYIYVVAAFAVVIYVVIGELPYLFCCHIILHNVYVVDALILSANLSCYEFFSALELLHSLFLYLYLTFPQVIAAEGEQKASRALREASEVIAESSSALQLRYLQVKKKGESGYHIPTWGGI